MRSHLLVAVRACVVMLLASTTANASLGLVLGGQAVYDTDLDITWLADANLAKTSGFDADGQMNWANANAWAAGLTVGGIGGWRLPTTADPDASCTDDPAGTTPSSDPFGWNCTGSEMGHLFYNELGGTASNSILTSGDPLGPPFLFGVERQLLAVLGHSENNYHNSKLNDCFRPKPVIQQN